MNVVMRWQNLLHAAIAMLNASDRLPTKAPPPELVVKETGFAVQVDDDVTDCPDAQSLSAALADLPEREIDLVFEGRSALDVAFTVPNGPFSDLKAMIDSEIAFRSPFQRDQCLWFWTAHETEDGTWQVEAAILLKSTLAPVTGAITGARKTVLHARRCTSDGNLRISTSPVWLAPQRRVITGRVAQRLRLVPPALRLPAAGFSVFLVCFIAVSVAQNFRHSTLSDQAAAANEDLRRIASAQSTGLALQARQSLGLAKLNVVGSLAQSLPDDYWLEQVIIEDDSLAITGYGPSAAEVTRILTDLPALTDIQFGSPVTRDNSQNLERYRINATIAGNGA